MDDPEEEADFGIQVSIDNSIGNTLMSKLARISVTANSCIIT